MRKLNNKGFSGIESLLIVIILAIIGGVGYYIMQSKQDTDKNLAPNSAQSTHRNTKYVTIKEWNVRAPYTGKDSLAYTIRKDVGVGQFASFTSAELVKADADCKSYGGGGIQRLVGEDKVAQGDGVITVAQAAKKTPSLYKQVGKFYFTFAHDNAACSTKPSVQKLQSRTNDDVKALVSKLQVSP